MLLFSEAFDFDLIPDLWSLSGNHTLNPSVGRTGGSLFGADTQGTSSTATLSLRDFVAPAFSESAHICLGFATKRFKTSTAGEGPTNTVDFVSFLDSYGNVFLQVKTYKVIGKTEFGFAVLNGSGVLLGRYELAESVIAGATTVTNPSFFYHTDPFDSAQTPWVYCEFSLNFTTNEFKLYIDNKQVSTINNTAAFAFFSGTAPELDKFALRSHFYTDGVTPIYGSVVESPQQFDDLYVTDTESEERNPTAISYVGGPVGALRVYSTRARATTLYNNWTVEGSVSADAALSDVDTTNIHKSSDWLAEITTRVNAPATLNAGEKLGAVQLIYSAKSLSSRSAALIPILHTVDGQGNAEYVRGGVYNRTIVGNSGYKFYSHTFQKNPTTNALFDASDFSLTSDANRVGLVLLDTPAHVS